MLLGRRRYNMPGSERFGIFSFANLWTPRFFIHSSCRPFRNYTSSYIFVIYSTGVIRVRAGVLFALERVKSIIFLFFRVFFRVSGSDHAVIRSSRFFFILRANSVKIGTRDTHTAHVRITKNISVILCCRV